MKTIVQKENTVKVLYSYFGNNYDYGTVVIFIVVKVNENLISSVSFRFSLGKVLYAACAALRSSYLKKPLKMVVD